MCNRPIYRLGLFASLLLGLTAGASADRIRGSSEPLPHNATVFIDPIDGFGPVLEQALLKESISWVIVSNKENADFEITGTIRDIADTETGVAFVEGGPDTDQSVEGQAQHGRLVMLSIVNARTKSIVWGCGVEGAGVLTNAAESCAKRMRNQIRHKHQR